MNASECQHLAGSRILPGAEIGERTPYRTYFEQLDQPNNKLYFFTVPGCTYSVFAYTVFKRDHLEAQAKTTLPEKDKSMHTLITKLIKIDLQQLALPIAGLLAAIMLQGCIHVQQPKSNTDISIYQPKVSELQYSKNRQSKPQIIGHFSISTHSKGAFLESVQFRPSAINNAFTQVRVKLVGDDQWFTPSEVNIFLEYVPAGSVLNVL